MNSNAMVTWGFPEIILPPLALASWRKKLPANRRLVVVVGSFDLLQPGNLTTLHQARQQGHDICILLQPDSPDTFSPGQRPPRRSWRERAESLSHMRDISVITAFLPEHYETILASLKPFTWVTCQNQVDTETGSTPLHHFADAISLVPPVDGCFTEQVHQAIHQQATPIIIPEPLPWITPVPDPRPALAPQQTRVTVNGCFDILHVGHLRMLQQASSMGDELVVMINDDSSVRRYKGPTRPIFPSTFRRAALRSLRWVADVYTFSEDNPLRLMRQLRPAIHVKGGSFEGDRVNDERSAMAEWGGAVAFCPLVKGYSTTEYIRQVLE